MDTIPHPEETEIPIDFCTFVPDNSLYYYLVECSEEIGEYFKIKGNQDKTLETIFQECQLLPETRLFIRSFPGIGFKVYTKIVAAKIRHTIDNKMR